jgi:hypothetical protein
VSRRLATRNGPNGLSRAVLPLKREAATADLGSMRYVALLIRELFLTVSASRAATKPR